MAKDARTEPPDPRAVRIEKWLLYVVVWTCGAALMALEIAGSRVIAPFFGSGIFTWGSLIGIFMTALAGGYFVGGTIADRWPRLTLLAGIVAFAGLFTLLIPAISLPVCDSISRSRVLGGARIGPLVSSLVLFVLPSILLGMVSPYSVRLSARELRLMGNVAGRLYALSTFGSIVGTLATAFGLLPYLGARTIIYLIGVLLIVLGAVVIAVLTWTRGGSARKLDPKIRATSAAVLILGLLVGYAGYPAGAGVVLETQWKTWRASQLVFTPEEIIHHEDSAYHLIVVTEQDCRREGRYRRRRVLRFNDRIESAIYTPVRHYRIGAAADGRLAVADNAGIITVKKQGADPPPPLYTLDGHKGAEVTVLSFSPDADGTYLLSGGTDGLLRIWKGGREKKTLVSKAPNRSITCAAWSPDGKRVVAGYFGGTLEIYDVAKGRIIASRAVTEIKRVNAVAYHPRDESFAAAYEGGQVIIHATGEDLVTLKTLEAHTDATGLLPSRLEVPGPLHTFGNKSPAAWALCYDADGKRLFTGGDGGEIRIWDPVTGAPLGSLSVGDRRVYHLALDPGGNLLAAAGAEILRYAGAEGRLQVLLSSRGGGRGQRPVPAVFSSVVTGPGGKPCYAARADRSVFEIGREKPVHKSDALVFESAVDYTKLLHLGLIFKPDPENVLVVGGGGGIAPREFREHYGVEVEVAELDGQVETICKRSDVGFGLEGVPGIVFHIGDGRRTLRELPPDKKYDYIILDAYSSGGQIPFHLMTKEFLQLCRSRLTPDGVVVSNVISSLDGKGSRLYFAEYRTLLHEEVGFKQVYTFYKRYSDTSMRDQQINIILVATRSDEKRLSPRQIAGRARKLTRRSPHPVKVRDFVTYAKNYKEEDYDAWRRLVGGDPLPEMPAAAIKMLRMKWDPVPVLTDDFAPVDTMYYE